MAKALIVCYRGGLARPLDAAASRICARVAPDNAAPRPPYVFAEPGLFCVVYNPPLTIRARAGSVRLGVTTGDHDGELRPGSGRPDGTFALFRADAAGVEILSDFTGSRTVWYYRAPHLFVASTSQRMILTVLGDLCWNEVAVGWMLTNGHLGPGEAWDRRLEMLPPGSTLRFDRRAWTLSIETVSGLGMRPEPLPDVVHRQLLGQAVEDAVRGLGLRPREWTLGLSGGMDSRSVVHHLGGGESLHTVTWGLAAAPADPASDAAIARRVAVHYRCPHDYVHTDLDPHQLEATLSRFVAAGEGRIDHLSGYMDGLAFWGSLSTTGRGILRGYDAFGRKPPVLTEYEAQRANSISLRPHLAVWSALPAGLAGGDRLPQALQRSHDETLEDWRDRLWLQFRTPVVTAALDEVKAAYVEIANPLLCERLVRVVRSLPAHLRERKVVFASLVSEMTPGIPFASRGAVQPLAAILAAPAMRSFLAREMHAGIGRDVLPDALLGWLARRLEWRVRRSAGDRLRQLSRDWLPDWARYELRMRRRRGRLPVARMALRAAIVLRTHAMLRGDASALLDTGQDFADHAATSGLTR